MLFGIGTKVWASIATGLVLMGALVAGVVADDESFDPVHAPQWQAGYSTSYDVTAEISSVISDGIEGFDIPSETNMSIGPIPVKKEILSTQYRDSDGQPVYLSAATFPFSSFQAGAPVLSNLGMQQAYANAERQSDLAPVPVTHDMSCMSNDCPGGGINFFAGNDMTYLQFPLSQGKYWEQEVDLDFPVPIDYLEGINRMHVIGEVGGMETVELAMGPTEAVRVDISYTPVGLQDVVNRVAQQLEDMGIELDRFTVEVGMHEIVHYSPEYEAIVQQTYIIRGLVDIAGRGSVQGYEFDESIYAEANVRLDSVLTGADRVAGEELSPLQILNKIADPAMIADAQGKIIQQTPYTLRLSASEHAVNAADDPLVKFKVALEGVPQLPEGHELVYHVHDASGSRIVDTAATDGEFQLKFDEPGVYKVWVDSMSDTGHGGSAAVTIVANYEDEVEADCFINILAGAQCDAFEFPVNAGIQSLSLQTQARMLSPALQENMHVIDGRGEDYVVDGDEELIFEAADLQDRMGTWSMEYENYGAPEGDVTYLITAEYGVPQHAVYVEGSPDPEAPGGKGGLMVDWLTAADGMMDLLQ